VYFAALIHINALYLALFEKNTLSKLYPIARGTVKKFELFLHFFLFGIFLNKCDKFVLKNKVYCIVHTYTEKEYTVILL
jgi:hypothetical protein